MQFSTDQLRSEVGIWARIALQARGQEFVAQERWEDAVALAEQSQRLLTGLPDIAWCRAETRPILSTDERLFENVLLHLGTNFVDDGAALRLADWAADPALQDHHRRRIFVHDGRRGVVFAPTHDAGRLPAAVDLTHAWSQNWFHFLLEVCGRAIGTTLDAPVLVNRACTTGTYGEALALFLGHAPRIVPSGHWGKVAVGELHQPRGGWRPSHYHADPARRDHHDAELTDPDGARAMFSRAVPRGRPKGNRIAVVRGSAGRPRCVNEPELVDALVARGFTSVSPETLPLAEQAAAFWHADVVVGVSGAAFANLVFCRPGTRVLCLRDADSDAQTFSALARGLALDFTYVDCRQVLAGPTRDYGIAQAEIPAILRMLG